MFKKIAAVAVVICSLGTASIAFASETLVSELVNDHKPGAAQVKSTATAPADHSKEVPAGAACHYGTDCRSSLCEANVCTLTSLEEHYNSSQLTQLAIAR
jgi:hypothetical protein